MSINQKSIEKIKNFPKSNSYFLKEIIEQCKIHYNGKRRIMYSDIINLIIRKDYIEDKYNFLLLWCNYMIRIGEVFVESE